MKMNGRIRLLSARALASAVPISMIVSTMMAPNSAMTLFQALANKVKQVDTGKFSTPQEEPAFDEQQQEQLQQTDQPTVRPTVRFRRPIENAFNPAAGLRPSVPDTLRIAEPGVGGESAVQPIEVQTTSYLAFVITASVVGPLVVVGGIVYYLYTRKRRSKKQSEKHKETSTVKRSDSRKHGKRKRHASKPKSKESRLEEKRDKQPSDKLSQRPATTVSDESIGLMSK